MLGSGGFLVADAVGEGTIPNFANSAWVLDGSSTVGGNGSYVFSGAEASGGIAFLDISLQPGERYRISGTFTLTGNATAPSYHLSLFPSDGKEIVLIDTTSKGSVWVNTEFVMPESGTGGVRLYIVLSKPWSTIEHNSNWKIENTSTDKGILNSIKEGFSKLWEWLQKVWDSIREIPTKIAESLTALGDRIRDFFSNLGDRIGNFFTDLWERIKAFFLPSDDFFKKYSGRFKTFVEDHFGFISDISNQLSYVSDLLVNYTPADPPYIDFPTIRVPIPGHEFTLVEGQRYTFTILTQAPYNTLYTAYQGFVWLAYCLMLFNFLKHKYNVIFGGNSSAD